ncbi:hypothetical protein GQ457_07G012610 [Hibiscus cannabinus]
MKSGKLESVFFWKSQEYPQNIFFPCVGSKEYSSHVWRWYNGSLGPHKVIATAIPRVGAGTRDQWSQEAGINGAGLEVQWSRTGVQRFHAHGPAVSALSLMSLLNMPWHFLSASTRSHLNMPWHSHITFTCTSPQTTTFPII